ncbi:CRISPR-associated endonuclease Cas2 [Candidatus Poribacteria bacterium]|nr:CRISPR-associated endonuclease Cas2 [Candidatus Poribacteria bacterium]
MFYVISYDIPDNGRRNQLDKVLKGYGTRVQYNVFEAHLNKPQFEELRDAVNSVIDPSDDSVRYYTLCSDCTDRIEETAVSEETSTPKQLSLDKQLPNLSPIRFGVDVPNRVLNAV